MSIKAHKWWSNGQYQQDVSVSLKIDVGSITINILENDIKCWQFNRTIVNDLLFVR
jgi:hypothetical protein